MGLHLIQPEKQGFFSNDTLMAVLSLSTVPLSGYTIHVTLLPRFLFMGVSQGQDLWKS